MAKQAKTLRDLALVRADNKDLFDKVAGSQGTALGRKNYDPDGNPKGQPAIIVYVPTKVNEKLLAEGATIPKKVESGDGSLWAYTDVVVSDVPEEAKKKEPVLTPDNEALIQRLRWKDPSLDYIPCGAQVGFGGVGEGGPGSYVGTIGYVVRKKGDPSHPGILTNQHVGVHPGHSLYVPSFTQKSARLGLTREVLEYVADEDWLPGVDEKRAYVRADCAFVEVEEQMMPLLRGQAEGFGKVGKVAAVDLDSMGLIGLPVVKVGRTTGLQYGTVVAFGFGISSEEDYLDRLVGREPANFYTDLLIAPRKPSTVFSDHGDSGSPILLDTDDGRRGQALGLLWGGWPGDIGRKAGLEDLTYGILVSRILESLDLELA
jgi:hypothetical protein